MNNVKKGDWRGWIRGHGIKETAEELGVHYETVRLWVNTGGRLPKDVLKRKLVEIGGGAFGIADLFDDVNSKQETWQEYYQHEK